MLRFCLNRKYTILFENNENVDSTNKNDAILYDGILTPQRYLEMMTGEYFCIYADNQYKSFITLLDIRQVV